MSGPVLRIFEARTKPGHAEELLENFATTSAAVVTGEPGNKGYIFGRSVAGDDDTVLFISLWESLDAIQARFDDDWQVSYMPDGYVEIIEEHSVRHFDMDGGWHPDKLQDSGL
ncbi:MAG: antibiotic biosynthesis monooxygenase family protein [Rhodospirillaceae bacterium]